MIENLLRPTHLLMIALVYLVCFGPEKLPAAGKSFAEAIKAFKSGLKE